ncbi:MAG: hypothetical protein AAGD14_16210 [Planctomycetota bacterium]
MVRTPLLLLLLAAPLLAQDLKSWQKTQRTIDRQEARFWKEFKSRFQEAYREFRQPVEDARDRPDADPESLFDYAPILSLYEDAARFAEQRGTADRALALTDGKARAALLKALIDNGKQMRKIEEEIEEPKPDFSRYVFQQSHGCRLHALAQRRAALVEALATAPLDFLTGDAWKKATKADGKKMHRNRVAIVDAVARGKSPEAAAALTAWAGEAIVAVRVAAAEALAARSDDDTSGLLGDESPIVRRATLLTLSRLPVKEMRGGWFAPVLACAERARGFERQLAVAVLGRLTRQPFGHDLTAWKQWGEEYGEELKSGKFDPATVEVAEVKPKAADGAFAFYELPIEAAGAIFVIDESQHIAMPADVDVQKTQWRDEWRGTRAQWEKEHVAHQTVLRAQFEGAFDAFPADFRWGMVALHGPFTAKTIGEKKLLKTGTRDRKAGLKLIDGAPQRGWCSAFQGLRTALAMAGEPVDTIVLWHTGDPSGGRFMGPEPAVAAWRRINRFRRVQVVAIRISNRKDPAEAFMKGVAEESGGRYLWAQKPPSGG